jgi:hypothetical protein
VHPRIQFWGELLELLGEAALKGVQHTHRALRAPGPGYQTLRPGPDTPLWNMLATHVRGELRPYGSKVRLARYLGIPKQRVSDFLAGRRRMPDAELTLRLVHWLVEKRAGRDPSL